MNGGYQLKLGMFFVAVVIVSLVMLAAQTVASNGGETWSSWCQAIGTVVAVFVAIWVPYHQQRISRAEDRERRETAAAAFALPLLPKIQNVQQGITRRLGYIEHALRLNPSADSYDDMSDYWADPSYSTPIYMAMDFNWLTES
jgi:hypothetical protein